jgi:hypothetical protein
MNKIKPAGTDIELTAGCYGGLFIAPRGETLCSRAPRIYPSVYPRGATASPTDARSCPPRLLTVPAPRGRPLLRGQHAPRLGQDHPREAPPAGDAVAVDVVLQVVSLLRSKIDRALPGELVEPGVVLRRQVVVGDGRSSSEIIAAAGSSGKGGAALSPFPRDMTCPRPPNQRGPPRFARWWPSPRPAARRHHPRHHPRRPLPT